VKGLCKNSPTPSKEKNLRIMGLEKEKRCKQKELIIYATKYRKFPKSTKNYAHSGKGILQDTKQTGPK
jgi:hypothetical protein